MRYLLAILGGMAGLGVVAFFAGIPLADWVVARQSFRSPTDADDMHMWVFLGSMLGGLAAGWFLGWSLGGRFEGEDLDI